MNVVREDTQRNGLLFAGTERAVYVSFDDGDNWESLRLNMPRHRFGTLLLRTTIWRSQPTVAAFGYLITLPRCGSGIGASVRRFYSNLKPHFEFGGVSIPIRRFHQMSPPAKIRPTAR